MSLFDLGEFGKGAAASKRARPSRDIRTWRVGDVGVEGTRRVSEGGTFDVNGVRYQSDRLVPFVGEIVFFHDDDDGYVYEPGTGRRLWTINVYSAHWHFNGRVGGGRWLCRAVEVCKVPARVRKARS